MSCGPLICILQACVVANVALSSSWASVNSRRALIMLNICSGAHLSLPHLMDMNSLGVAVCDGGVLGYLYLLFSLGL
jgi:hypothetical protein